MPTSEAEDAAQLRRLHERQQRQPREAAGQAAGQAGQEGQEVGGGTADGTAVDSEEEREEEMEDAWREEAALYYRLGQKRRLRLTAAALLALQTRLAAREARHAHLGLWWAAQRAHLTRRGRPARRFRSAARGPALVRLRAGPAAVTLEAALETVRSGGQAGHTAK